MRLRSEKYLPKMTRPSMDNPNWQNNSQNIVEQPVRSTVKEEVISMPVRTTSLVVSSTSVAPIPSQGITPPPHPGNSVFNPVVARPLFGFSMQMNNRDYPYGMPTSMMVVIHTNMSTYSDNAVVTRPSYNPHNASLITNTNQTYELLANQTDWIANFFGTPQVQAWPTLGYQTLGKSKRLKMGWPK